MPLKREIRAVEYSVGGSAAEAICGLGAVALGILGLSGVLLVTFAAIATIAAGTGLFLAGVAFSSSLSTYVSEAAGRRVTAAEMGGGVTAEVVGGLGAIALGILALVGISGTMLMGIAAISLGGALLFGSAVFWGIRSFHLTGRDQDEPTRKAIREATRAASGAQILVGVGAVALGILAILSIIPLTLDLVAMIAVGGSGLLSGGAITGRMAKLLSR